MNDTPFKILFFSYTFPPKVVGGVQTYIYEVTSHFKKIHPETYTIINTRGLWFIPFFIPYSIVKAVYLIRKHGITHVHACDGFHSFQGHLIKKLTGVKTSITIHGLDVIYDLFIFRKLGPKVIAKFDRVICVSNATRTECIMRGIPEDRCVVILNGVDPSTFPMKQSKPELRRQIEARLGISLKNRTALFTNGRLMKRKGVEWFIRRVMPRLEKKYIYIVSGQGPEKDAITTAVRECSLEGRVFVLGKTDFETLRLLYNGVDLFIMPNIRVYNTMEGFGLVILEANSCGTPVIAANIEGITDAVVHGVTGWLVTERNVDEYVKYITKPRLPGGKIAGVIQKKFNWATITKRYFDEIRGI